MTAPAGMTPVQEVTSLLGQWSSSQGNQSSPLAVMQCPMPFGYQPLLPLDTSSLQPVVVFPQHPLQSATQAGPRIDELFSPFGIPQVAAYGSVPSGAAAAAAASSALASSSTATNAMSEEALRESVLIETIARLLREKTGSSSTSVLPPWRREASTAQNNSVEPPTGSSPTVDPSIDASSTPASLALANEPTSQAEAAVVREGAPLEKFIRIFGLDELAAKCLMKLQDDEAAFVIESCQNRLKYAKNPSAVVMIAIKGVAAKVGRRYWGSRESGQGKAAGNAVGGLQMFEGSPVPDEKDDDDRDVASKVEAAHEAIEGQAQFDPYMVGDAAELSCAADDQFEEEEEEEEGTVVDEEIPVESLQSSKATSSSEIRRPAPEGAATVTSKRLRVDVATDLQPLESNDRITVEVFQPTPEAISIEEDEAELPSECLFFVDTGG